MNIKQLEFLLGTWNGIGYAEYPTIQPMDYIEELVFASNQKDSVLHYEQRTWKKNVDGTIGEPIFWESGFLIEKNDGIFELVSAQKSGRIELLSGALLPKDHHSFSLELASKTILNDSRMLSSSRHFEISPAEIRYQLQMSTHSHPSPHVHLTAKLTKTHSR